jgi:mRNA-degrading endonuclease RelE of RelBE toxin-antitoxin system
MTYSIAWAPPALAVLYRLPMHSAMLVDRAVIRLAEAGEGDIAWEPPYHHLRAGKYDLLLAIERTERRLTVLHIYRAR